MKDKPARSKASSRCLVMCPLISSTTVSLAAVVAIRILLLHILILETTTTITTNKYYQIFVSLICTTSNTVSFFFLKKKQLFKTRNKSINRLVCTTASHRRSNDCTIVRRVTQQYMLVTFRSTQQQQIVEYLIHIFKEILIKMQRILKILSHNKTDSYWLQKH